MSASVMLSTLFVTAVAVLQNFFVDVRFVLPDGIQRVSLSKSCLSSPSKSQSFDSFPTTLQTRRGLHSESSNMIVSASL